MTPITDDVSKLSSLVRRLRRHLFFFSVVLFLKSEKKPCVNCVAEAERSL